MAGRRWGSPSAVDSDRGGNCVAAVFLVVDGQNLCAINVYIWPLIFDFISLIFAMFIIS